jgi:hypothetical protein
MLLMMQRFFNLSAPQRINQLNRVHKDLPIFSLCEETQTRSVNAHFFSFSHVLWLLIKAYGKVDETNECNFEA